MRTIEAIKNNKRAIICKCYISILLYFSFTKKRAAFCPSNNKRTHLMYNQSQISIISESNRYIPNSYANIIRLKSK